MALTREDMVRFALGRAPEAKLGEILSDLAAGGTSRTLMAEISEASRNAFNIDWAKLAEEHVATWADPPEDAAGEVATVKIAREFVAAATEGDENAETQFRLLLTHHLTAILDVYERASDAFPGPSNATLIDHLYAHLFGQTRLNRLSELYFFRSAAARLREVTVAKAQACIETVNLAGDTQRRETTMDFYRHDPEVLLSRCRALEELEAQQLQSLASIYLLSYFGGRTIEKIAYLLNLDPSFVEHKLISARVMVES